MKKQNIFENIIFLLICTHIIFAPISIYIAQRTILLGLLVWGIKSLTRYRTDWIKTPLDIPLGLFLMFSGISSIVNPSALNLSESLRYFVSYIYFGLFFLISNNVNTKGRLMILLNLFVFSAALYAPFTIKLRLGMAVSGESVTGLGSHTEAMRYMFAMAAVLTLLKCSGKWQRVGYAILCCLILCAELVNFKRAPIIGTLCIILIFSFSSHVNYIAIGLIGMIFIVFMGFMMKSDDLKKHWINIIHRPHIVRDQSVLLSVMELSCRVGLEGAMQHPLGYGGNPKRFMYAYKGYDQAIEKLLEGKDPYSYWKQLPDRKTYYRYAYFVHKKNRLGKLDHIHDTLFQVYLRDGIFGLFALIFILVKQVLYYGKSKLMYSKRQRTIALSMLAASAGFFVSGISNAHFESSKVVMAFILFFGITNALINQVYPVQEKKLLHY